MQPEDVPDDLGSVWVWLLASLWILRRIRPSKVVEGPRSSIRLSASSLAAAATSAHSLRVDLRSWLARRAKKVTTMQLQTFSAPLGEATTVTVDLPRRELGHSRPWDELAALHAAGLESTPAVFIDPPTEELDTWPSADAAFLHAIAGSKPEATVSPLVWARIRTAPRYPSLGAVKSEKFPFHAEQPVPREPTWPPDFSGVPTEPLYKTLRDKPGSRLVLHIPPGDGWHRVAWVRQDIRDLSMTSLVCECSLQQVVKVGGGTISFRGDADCAYRPVDRPPSGPVASAPHFAGHARGSACDCRCRLVRYKARTTTRRRPVGI